MSKHLFSMNKDDEEYFNSKLYFALKKYNESKEENNSNEEIEQKLNFQNLNNDNFILQECLSKDLLETIDSLSPVNEFKKEENIIDTFNLDETNDSSILFYSSQKSASIDDDIIQNDKNKEIIPLVDNNYSFIPKNFIFRKQRGKKYIEGRPGDWICYFCQNLNFSFRIKCNRCGVLKEESENEKNKIVN